LLCVAAAALLAVVAMPLVGRWSDQAGHERVFRLGAAAMVLFAFVYAAALETANGTFIGAVIVASLLPYAVMYGVEGAIFAKSFRPEWRYSGSSLAFNLAGIIGGGPAPLVATWLIARTGSPFAIGAYIALAGAIGMVAATAMLRRNRPLAASRDVETRSASAVPVTVAAVSS
jgi:MFS family permease